MVTPNPNRATVDRTAAILAAMPPEAAGDALDRIVDAVYLGAQEVFAMTPAAAATFATAFGEAVFKQWEVFTAPRRATLH